jgi:hypothetical protein
MAFTGIHIICANAGGQSVGIQALISSPHWSETLATPGTTTKATPSASDSPQGKTQIFRIRAAADSWVALGETPNAITGTRYFVPANVDYDVFAGRNEKVAWIAA